MPFWTAATAQANPLLSAMLGTGSPWRIRFATTPRHVCNPPFERPGLRRHPDVGLEPLPNGVKRCRWTEPGKHGLSLESPRLEPWGCLPSFVRVTTTLHSGSV
jgi:hypothetical protein